MNAQPEYIEEVEVEEAPPQHAVAVRQESNAVTPMDMLDRAVSSGASIETLEKLMALQERWEANQARKAFDAAISDAKSEIPIVTKNATGHNSKRYADFSAYAAALKPILAKYGLSYRFRSDQTDRITVTCILSHKDGHSEESTLSGPADASGNKNAIQAIGSTLTYLQRYTLVQALGLAAAEDDDGKAATSSETGDPERISEAQLKQIRRLLEETNSDVAAFCRIGNLDALPDMPAVEFDGAIRMLEQKKAKQRAGAQ